MTNTLDPYRIRIQSVDILRGIVMVIMALDHVRAFMGATPYPPEDPTQTSGLLFFTRWITHFCAPVFVFLAGTSAFLYARNTGCDNKTLRNFLFTRGIWIILVEILLLNLVVQFIPYQVLLLQVLWVIGWSMIILSALIYLPDYLILIFGLTLVFGHNLLDYFTIDAYQPGFWFFAFLHQKAVIYNDYLTVFIYYPLLPWPGVMALGYVFGRVLVLPLPRRNHRIWALGVVSIVLFLVFRYFNIYGDPHPWTSQLRGAFYTFLSFLNTEKYPASLLFLLMTLGPALLTLPWLEKWQGWKVNFFGVFGKVPFFYYLIHFLIIHIIALGWSRWRFGESDWWLGVNFPPAYTLDLSLVYGVWLAVLVFCYPICRWYANYKRKNKQQWWLSYL